MRNRTGHEQNIFLEMCPCTQAENDIQSKASDEHNELEHHDSLLGVQDNHRLQLIAPNMKAKVVFFAKVI